MLTVQIRDRQLCFSMGVPVVVNDQDYDVEELTMDDFPEGEAEVARYIILSVELNQAGKLDQHTRYTANDVQSRICISDTARLESCR